MNFHFLTVVWGAAYTDLFLTLSLPSQLAPRNLPGFPGRRGSRYRIYAPSPSAEQIRRSPAFDVVSETMRTEIIEIDRLDLREKYAAMSACHRDGVAAAGAEGAALCFLSPDTVWADGAFCAIRSLTEAGARAIMIAGLRTKLETLVPALELGGFRLSDGSLSVSARKLARIGLTHLHPISSSLLWDSIVQNLSPSHLYWPVGDAGLLARCFHLHPLVICPDVHAQGFQSTIDDDLLPACRLDPATIHVVEDSDEMAVMEVSHAGQSAGMVVPRRLPLLRVAHWAREHANPLHRQFVRRRIRFHSTECDRRWEAIEHRSDRTVEAILRLTALLERLPYVACVRILRYLIHMPRLVALRHTAAPSKDR